MSPTAASTLTMPALAEASPSLAHGPSTTSVTTPTPLRRDAYGRMVAVPRRERARRGEGDRLREEILEAAEFLLAKYGHDDAVSIRAVANRVGCTPPAIYLHFTDKTQLLFEVCSRRFIQLGERIDAAVAQHTSPLDQLVAGSHAYIAFGLEHPEHYRILFMQKAILTPEQWKDLRLSTASGFDPLERRVIQSIEAGEISGDSHQIAMAIWQLAHGIVSLIIAKPKWGWDEVTTMTDHLLGTYIRGLSA
jgi:AcrR family transcriptional regulator